MCNACGFFCCAYDGFSKCGCDHCPCPQCWDDEFEDADDFDDFDDGYEVCEDTDESRARFVCVEIPGQDGESAS